MHQKTEKPGPGIARTALRRIAVLLLLGSMFGSCVYEETVELTEAYVQVYVAVAYKASECGGQPAYPLVMIDEPSRYAVDACVFSIVRSECPFQDYPLLCFELYNTDVPGVGPELQVPSLGDSR